MIPCCSAAGCKTSQRWTEGKMIKAYSVQLPLMTAIRSQCSCRQSMLLLSRQLGAFYSQVCLLAMTSTAKAPHAKLAGDIDCCYECHMLGKSRKSACIIHLPAYRLQKPAQGNRKKCQMSMLLPVTCRAQSCTIIYCKYLGKECCFSAWLGPKPTDGLRLLPAKADGCKGVY